MKLSEFYKENIKKLTKQANMDIIGLVNIISNGGLIDLREHGYEFLDEAGNLISGIDAENVWFDSNTESYPIGELTSDECVMLLLALENLQKNEQ